MRAETVNGLWRLPFVIASLARLAYGLGAMFVPEWMAGKIAPTLRGHPDPRMNLRGFGGAQTGIALYTLANTVRPEDAQRVLALNALVDIFDAGVTLLERRDRGETDAMVVGGVAVNIAGLLCWTGAAAALRRNAQAKR